MNRQQFGRLIAALRHEHFDEFGARWTQQHLASVSGISPAIVGGIERGGRTNLSAELLITLADTLELTSGERKEFFAAASGVDNVHISQPGQSDDLILQRQLRTLEQMQLPCILLDCFGNIVAGNVAMLTLFNIELSKFFEPDINPLTRFNLVRALFAPEFQDQRTLLNQDWMRLAHSSVMIFRTLTFPHRSDPYFKRLLPELSRYRVFRQFWVLHKLNEADHAIDSWHGPLEHPRYGTLRFTSSAITAITSRGDLRLLPLLPLDAQTAVAFASILKNGGHQIESLSNWPDSMRGPA